MNTQLAAAIARDDEAEDAGMHADDRQTCHTHQTWSADCAGERVHANPSAFDYPRG